MFLKYPGIEANWATYVNPFHSTLWISLLSLLSLITMLLSATYYIGPERQDNRESFSISNSALIVLGSQICQGSWIDPKYASSRIIVLVSFSFGILLYTSYTAELISFLTLHKTTLPFNTLDEIRGTKFGMGAVVGSGTLDSFLNAPEGSTHWKVAEEIIKKDPANMPSTVEAGIEKAKEGKYAFVWQVDIVHALTRDSCDLLEIPYDVNTGHLSLAWSKHLPHRHFFDHFIYKMKQSGQIDRILQKWRQNPRSDCGYEGEFISMGLNNMISSFALVATGIVFAVVCLSVEIAFSFWKRPKAERFEHPRIQR